MAENNRMSYDHNYLIIANLAGSIIIHSFSRKRDNDLRALFAPAIYQLDPFKTFLYNLIKVNYISLALFFARLLAEQLKSVAKFESFYRKEMCLCIVVVFGVFTDLELFVQKRKKLRNVDLYSIPFTYQSQYASKSFFLLVLCNTFFAGFICKSR